MAVETSPEENQFWDQEDWNKELKTLGVYKAAEAIVLKRILVDFVNVTPDTLISLVAGELRECFHYKFEQLTMIAADAYEEMMDVLSKIHKLQNGTYEEVYKISDLQ